MPGELGRRTERGELAAGDDRDAVAEVLGLVHRVGREQHRHAALAQVADELPGCGPGVRVHSRGRFVEEDDLGLADQRAGEREALALTAGEAPDGDAAASCKPTVSSNASGVSASS